MKHLLDVNVLLAAIWATPAGPGQAQLPIRLIFGQPLVLQTAGNSELWIESSS